MRSRFEAEKARALEALYRSLEQGVVDPDALPLLALINSMRDYYTTSSCSGRAQLAATKLPGEKGAMLVLAKWHQPLDATDLAQTLSVAEHSDLWLAVQGPILHVVCRDVTAALRLLSAARRAGLKHSGILWIGKRVVVEIIAPDKVELPLRLSDLNLVDEEHLSPLTERLNAVLQRAKARLSRLEAELARFARAEERF